jgi:hypothetical protein
MGFAGGWGPVKSVVESGELASRPLLDHSNVHSRASVAEGTTSDFVANPGAPVK